MAAALEAASPIAGRAEDQGGETVAARGTARNMPTTAVKTMSATTLGLPSSK